MGSVTFTNTYNITGIGSTTVNIRINYSESYSSSTNKTTVSLTSIEQSASRNFGSPVVRGAVQFNGTTVVTYPDNSSSYTVTLNSGKTTTYNAWTSKSASTVAVSHGTDGTASLTIKLVDTNSSGYFGAFYNNRPVGVPTNSEQTVSLTTHAYTLTTAVTPSGYGTVTAGATLAPTKTKSLTATPATQTAQYTYAFSKWTKTAGTLSSTTTNPTTFTMGTANATVTANFTRSTRSYTVTCKDYVGSTSGTLLGTSTVSYSYGSSVSGASFGSSTTYDAYYTGYHYTSSSSAVTVNAAKTVYRYFALNTWTVSYNANGHGTAPSSQTKTYGTDLTLRSFISNQTETGTISNYTVTGNANGGTWSGSNGSATRTPTYVYKQTYWNTNSSGTGTNYASQGTYKTNAAQTFYAKWTTNSTTYSYTYVLPSGTPSNTQSITVTFNANEGSTTKSSQDASRAMSFSGWYTEASGGTQRTTSSQISASETVYAHYSDGTGSYSSVTLPTDIQCTRSGYTLLGWSTSSTATTATYLPGASYTPTAAIILYAVWEAQGLAYINNEPYQIFIGNGASWDQYRAYIGDGNDWVAY